MLPRIRSSVLNLIRFKNSYDSCDEGEDQKHCKIEFTHVLTRRAQNTNASVPAIHCSWRYMPYAIIKLSDYEVKALTDAGFECKTDEDGDYISVIEKRIRHRWLAFNVDGWAISTAEDCNNLKNLVSVVSNPIPTIDVTPEVALYGSLIEHWHMIRANLPIAFSSLLSQCNDLLRVLYSEAILSIKYPNGISGITLPMGAIQILDKTKIG